METISEANRPSAGPSITMLLSGMAGGMAWGIRGQYGHETGAMIAGVLVGFTLVLLHGRHLSSLASARGVAMFALGISVGGSMTYGQTVGLTHDAALVGNSEAYLWGMCGLAIKGGVWIALGSAMFGMGVSGKRYGPLELGLLCVAMMAALLIGVQSLNRPFDIENRLLPWLYFSDHWYWEPDVDKPRLERWGGLVAALAVLLIYLAVVKKDWLGFSLGLWGLLAGAIGFPAGQFVQAYNAWHGDWIRSLPTSTLTNHFNWWNMMETTFGFVFGAIVGFGVWYHRGSIGQFGEPSGSGSMETDHPAPKWHFKQCRMELFLMFFYVWLLITWNFQSVPFVDRFADLALPTIVIPVVAVMSGRIWPFFVSLPIVLLPIAGKTVRHTVYQLPPEQATAVAMGWFLYIVVPLVVATGMAVYFARRSKPGDSGRRFSAVGLTTASWLYFGLNNAFFDSPWPWEDWTGRTANGLIFLLCSIGLTIAAIYFGFRTECETLADAP